MIESASGVRDRRRADTTRTLVSLARRATAAHGLHGFTVDEICDQAGISRRTFFNYFASKEDAVLGNPANLDSVAAEQRFLAARPADAVDGMLSATLLRDYATLIEQRWVALELDRESAGELMAAAEREPRLIAHMLERGRRDDLKDAALVEAREGLEPGDPRATCLVQIVGQLSRVAVPVSLDPQHPQPFSTVFERLLEAAHALFDSQSRTFTHTHESTR